MKEDGAGAFEVNPLLSSGGWKKKKKKMRDSNEKDVDGVSPVFAVAEKAVEAEALRNPFAEILVGNGSTSEPRGFNLGDGISNARPTAAGQVDKRAGANRSSYNRYSFQGMGGADEDDYEGEDDCSDAEGSTCSTSTPGKPFAEDSVATSAAVTSNGAVTAADDAVSECSSGPATSTPVPPLSPGEVVMSGAANDQDQQRSLRTGASKQSTSEFTFNNGAFLNNAAGSDAKMSISIDGEFPLSPLMVMPSQAPKQHRSVEASARDSSPANEGADVIPKGSSDEMIKDTDSFLKGQREALMQVMQCIALPQQSTVASLESTVRSLGCAVKTNASAIERNADASRSMETTVAVVRREMDMSVDRIARLEDRIEGSIEGLMARHAATQDELVEALRKSNIAAARTSPSVFSSLFGVDEEMAGETSEGGGNSETIKGRGGALASFLWSCASGLALNTEHVLYNQCLRLLTLRPGASSNEFGSSCSDAIVAIPRSALFVLMVEVFHSLIMRLAAAPRRHGGASGSISALRLFLHKALYPTRVGASLLRRLVWAAVIVVALHGCQRLSSWAIVSTAQSLSSMRRRLGDVVPGQRILDKHDDAGRKEKGEAEGQGAGEEFGPLEGSEGAESAESPSSG